MNSKQREELQKISAAITMEPFPNGWLIAPTCKMPLKEVKHIVDTILAAPPRNCDVGTAEEQSERFILFCRRNSCRGVCYDICNFANVNRRLGWQKIGQSRCFAFWAQMPYEEEK
jgi:hypothetical protein